MKKRYSLFCFCFLIIGTAHAQSPVNLKIHHFLPATSTVQKWLIEPWVERVEKDSKGALTFTIYPAMQLGGRPQQLVKQASDGVVDIIWTVAGYTPGRFPKLEVFELPFLARSAKATSAAAHEYAKTYAKEEFQHLYPILIHVHSPGTFHMRKGQIRSIEDFRGKKIRVPTKIVHETLKSLGAVPVFMPVPQVSQSLSSGVIDGTVLPYEVVKYLKVDKLTSSHTSLEMTKGIYTIVFLFIMNQNSYYKLNSTLRAIIRKHSGIPLALEVGQYWDEQDLIAEEDMRKAGDDFLTIPLANQKNWRLKTDPVIEKWVKNQKQGTSLLKAAQMLIEKYEQR